MINGVAFTGEGKLVRKATLYEDRKPKSRDPASGWPAQRAELPARHLNASVAHRFL